MLQWLGMTTATALKNEIRRMVRETVHEEVSKLRAAVLPLVFENEQREILKRYGKPSRRAVRTVRVRI